MLKPNSSYLGPIRAPLDKRAFTIGQRVWFTEPTSGIREKATIGGVTFDHIVTNFGIVLDEPITKAKYPELGEYYEGWFVFSAPSGMLTPLEE